MTLMKRERGGSFVELLAFLALMGAVAFWFGYDELPAEAADVQAVVSMASANADAKQAVVEALKEQPNVNRGQLRKLKIRINDILVTATAREVTGDKSLKTAEATKALEVRQRAAKADRSWSELDRAEKLVFGLAGGFAALLVLAGGIFGVRRIGR